MLAARQFISRLLLTTPKQQFARMDSYGLYFNDPEHKRLGYNKPFKTESYADELKLPAAQYSELGKLYLHVMKNDVHNYTSQSLAALTYNFGKENMMTPHMFERLYGLLNKFEGEFSTRTLYGFMWTAVKYNSQKYLEYFMEHLENDKHVFTPGEAIEMIEALRANPAWSLKQKRQFWMTHFFPNLKQFMTLDYKDNNPKRVMKVLRHLEYLQVYDHELWAKLIKLLHNKRGWVRLEIYAMLSPHMERFPEAQELVDIIYQQVINNPDVVWRYNLQERRFYTNAEMIAKSQDNIKLIPDFQTLFTMEHVHELNVKFEQLKKTGTLLEEAQIQHDKAKALAYVLYDKFNRDKDDNISSEAEYDRVYGMSEEELKKLIAEAEDDELKSDESDDEEDSGEELSSDSEQEGGESSEEQAGSSEEESSSEDD